MSEKLKYKLVSCDMDDTLLRRDNTVSQRSLDAIHEFERRGGVFMANTGRMHSSVVKWVRKLNLLKNSPVASFQGAMINESGTGKLLFYKPLGYDISLRIVEEAERMGIHTQIYDMKDFYYVKPPEGMPDYGAMYAERCEVGYVNVPRLSGYMNDTRMDCVKVLLMDEPEKVKGHIKYFTDKYGAVANFNTSSPFMVEAFSKGAGKDVACDVICAAMGIGIEECMAIGDSMNDYTMIKHAGLGVAVANARPEVLEVAKYITESNDCDGVAAAIEKFCL